MASDADFSVLADRLDGLAWCFMALMCDLEMRELIDGPRFCDSMRRTAARKRMEAGQETAADTIGQLADQIDAARKTRRRMTSED